MRVANWLEPDYIFGWASIVSQIRVAQVRGEPYGQSSAWRSLQGHMDGTGLAAAQDSPVILPDGSGGLPGAVRVAPPTRQHLARFASNLAHQDAQRPGDGQHLPSLIGDFKRPYV